MKKFILVSILFIFCILSSLQLAQTTIAANKSLYFGRQLADWDISVYTVKEQPIDSVVPQVLPVNIPEEYFLVTTSQLTALKANYNSMLSFDKVIIICDSTFEINQDISCDFDSIDTKYQKITFDDVKDYSLLNINLDETNFIVSPEANFILHKNIPITTAYFTALSNSQNIEDTDVAVVAELSTENKIAFVKSELFLYLTLILLFNFVVIFPIVKLWNFRVVILKASTITKLLQKYKVFMNRFRPFILCFLAFLIVANIALSGMFIVNGGKSSVSSSLETLLERPTLSDLLGLEILKSTLALGVFAISFLIALVVILLLVEKPIAEFDLANAFPKRIKAATSKNIAISLIVLAAVIVILEPVIHSASVILILLLGLLYLLGISERVMFSTRNKIGILVLFAGICFVAVAYKQFFGSTSSKILHEPFFSQSATLTILPYQRSLDYPTQFDELELKTDFPIFLNQYLIYHPNFETVINRNLSELNQDGNYIVISKNEKDYINSLLMYPQLISAQPSQNISAFFMPLKYIAPSDVLKFRVTINCREDTAPTEIYFDKYMLNMEREQHDFFIFPGCALGENPVYEIPIDAGLFQIEGIFEINNFTKLNIEKLEFFVNNQDIELKFIQPFESYQFVSSEINAPDASEITVYSNQTTQSTTFTRSSEFANIAEFINQILLADGSIDKLIMWSSSGNAIIRHIN